MNYEHFNASNIINIPLYNSILSLNVQKKKNTVELNLKHPLLLFNKSLKLQKQIRELG